MALSLILLLGVLGISQACLFCGPAWNNLKVTWGLNPFKSFNHLPRTIQEAESTGWILNANCSETASYRGYRYILNNDPAVMLLFDKNGYIAGLQNGITGDIPAKYRKYRNMYVQENGKYTVTSYFVNPAIICSQGRTAAEFKTQGTGTGLFIQMGQTPDVHESIPLVESELTGTTWTRGGCFYSMGQHYWREVTEDMSCDDLEPVFLLYNRGKLNAFGWAHLVDQTSHRYEHPPEKAYPKFLVPVPKCLYNQTSRFSTMHIYFDNPLNNWC